ncbi:hypothetical protein ACFVHQ_11875 [Actinomycetes bacterium NPDC127524]
MKQRILMEKKKMRILLFGFINMNSMDGSAVFMSSLASVLAQDPNIEVDLLLARPPVRDILLQPLMEQENIRIINPYEDPYFIAKSPEWIHDQMIDFDSAQSLISHYWDKYHYDWLFVRSLETAEKLIKQPHILKRTFIYATGLTHKSQHMNDGRYSRIKKLYDHCAYFLCQTKEMKDYTVNKLKLHKENNRIAILSPMIPDAEIGQYPSVSGQRLVYTGKFDPDWKTLQIITGFKEAKRKIPGITLDVAGDKFKHDKSNPLFKKSAAYLLQHTKGLNWHGALTRHDAQQLIIQSDVGITWRTEEMDTSLELSTKLLEYGICKKAVIMNPTSMHLRLFGEDYPFYAVTEKDFRNAIDKAFSSREQYIFAAERMYETSRRFTYKEVLKDLQPLIWSKGIQNAANS